MGKTLYKLGAFLLLLLNSIQWGYTQAKLTVEVKKIAEGHIVLLASNKNYSEYTIKLTAELTNMSSSEELPLYVSIKPQTKNQELTVLRSKSPGYYKYNYHYWYYLGTSDTRHQEEYVYQLPYLKGDSAYIGQGYDGKYSHYGPYRYAIDFFMEEGTKICAAREGVVTLIKEDSNSGCPSRDCIDMVNYVRVTHEDGSFAEYVHLQQDGVLVEYGQKVKKGQVIGLSGNTGWSTEPHLHFAVYEPRFDPKKDKVDRQTVKTYFLIGENQPKAYLEQGETYTGIE